MELKEFGSDWADNFNFYYDDEDIKNYPSEPNIIEKCLIIDSEDEEINLIK